MSSVYTQIDLLTRHLKDPDFFDAAKYPLSTFESIRVSPPTAGATDQTVTGTLTLHGITKRISFPAHLEFQRQSVLLAAKLTIHQSDFHMASAHHQR